MTEREKAVREVLSTLRHPLKLMSPDRERAYELAREHNITAIDLLDLARSRARNA